MAIGIEVRVNGRGVVHGDEAREDPTVQALCSLCGKECDIVASVSPPGADGVHACPSCLRERLDALSVGRWRLREGQSLPWGRVSG
jgi:hypothetical protein